MIKNFENFLNENESIDPIKAVFNGSRDYTEIDNIDTFHNKMLSEIAAKLSSMNLTLPYKNSGRNLEVEFKRFADKEKTIQLSAEADSESGDIVYFYTWRDNDFWEGGYEEDVLMSDGSHSVASNNIFMSPEEFMGCLYNDDILSRTEFDTMIAFLKELRHKYRATITGAKYGV